MIGIIRALVLLSLPLGAAADGRSLQDPDSIPVETTDGTVLNLGQLDARLTVKVEVGKSGPFNFIIDTGAERTVVSRELAGNLRLLPGMPVNMTSMTGRSSVNTVIVPELFIQSIGQRHTIVAPSLYARNLGAAGLLGIDTLSRHQISIDFETETMTVRPSEKRARTRPRASDEIVVTARSKFGQLIVTDAFFGGSRIQVVLDTGSSVSMGNNALRRLVGRRINNMQKVGLTSVTGGQITADYTRVPQISLGGITFDTLPVAFAEVAPFARFGLTRRPALLLGMDALRSFRHVDIDFPNRQVRFLMPRDFRTTRKAGTLTTAFD